MGSIPGSGRSPGERHGNLLQYSCQENSIDRGAWQSIRSQRIRHTHGGGGALSAASIFGAQGRVCKSNTQACFCVCVGGGMWGGGKGEAFTSVRKLQTRKQEQTATVKTDFWNKRMLSKRSTCVRVTLTRAGNPTEEFTSPFISPPVYLPISKTGMWHAESQSHCPDHEVTDQERPVWSWKTPA